MMDTGGRYGMKDSNGEEMSFTDEQKRCIDYNSRSVLVIKGTAGSGKSMMVIKRAMEYRNRIMERRTGERVCIMTYTKTLTQGIRDVLEKNDIYVRLRSDVGAVVTESDTQHEPDRCLSVTHVDQYLGRLCSVLGLLENDVSPRGAWSKDGRSGKDRYQREYAVKQIKPEDRVALIKGILGELSAQDGNPLYKRDPKFWADEILWMYQNGMVDDDDRDAYMVIRREGRCKRYNIHMNRASREAVFDVFVRYNRALVKNNYMEWDRNYALLLRDHMGRIEARYKFEYLLIDEAQDLSLVKMKILNQLCTIDLNIAMDKNQSIYGQRWSFFKDLNFRPHVKTLSVMFRGTKEIDEFSADLKRVDDSLLETEDRYVNEVSNKESNIMPKIVRCSDPASEMEFVVNEAKVLGEGNSNVAILCLDHRHLRQFRTELDKAGVKSQFFIDDDFSPLTPGIKLITIYSAKGLGFMNVILPYFEEGVFPSSAESVINSVIENQISGATPIDYDDAIAEEVSGSRRLSYVAITRARLNVVITYSGRPSRFINEFDSSHYVLIDESHEPTVDERIVPRPFRTKDTEDTDAKGSKDSVWVGPGGDQKKETCPTEKILMILQENGAEYVDRRMKNGVLWIVETPRSKDVVKELIASGYVLRYTPNGSRNTGYRPAYYYEG